MKFLIIFATFLGFSFSLDANLTPVKHFLKAPYLAKENVRKFEPAFDGGRIINGFPVTSDTRFPFVTDNLVTWPDQSENICTGSILSNSWTITARQCMFCDICGFGAETVTMRVGSASRTGVRTSVFAVEAHWINSAPDHPDFALMRVSTPLTLSPTIQPIRLPTFPQARDFFENRPSVILGWGVIRVEGQSENQLHYGDVTITNRGACTPANVPEMSEYEFCARGAPTRPAGIGDGDQGGPMILLEGSNWSEFTIIGVLSTTRPSNTEQTPFIMALRIGQFWQYIHEVTGIEPRW